MTSTQTLTGDSSRKLSAMGYPGYSDRYARTVLRIMAHRNTNVRSAMYVADNEYGEFVK